jgi:dipeptide transport system ATP-binding protein
LLDLQRERDMALVLITHNMSVVAETARQVVVMYAGQVVEQGEVNALFQSPRHPYTAALLNALPERNVEHGRLPTIPGVVPGYYDRPHGCLFHPRCQNAQPRCREEAPGLATNGCELVRCHFPLARSVSQA